MRQRLPIDETVVKEQFDNIEKKKAFSEKVLNDNITLMLEKLGVLILNQKQSGSLFEWLEQKVKSKINSRKTHENGKRFYVLLQL